MASPIRLGPYKVSKEFWRRLQALPGSSDEQRVLMAVAFVIEMHEAQAREIAKQKPRTVMQRVADAMPWRRKG